MVKRNELEKWAAHINNRRVIAEFIAWLQEHPKHSGKEVLDLNPDRLLDEYHNIDIKRLERERRALLDEHRKLIKEK